MDAVAKRAELLARAAALKKRQALEEYETKIRKEKEVLELDTEIAAQEARIKVYKQFESEEQDMEDGMDRYARPTHHQQTTSSNVLSTATRQGERVLQNRDQDTRDVAGSSHSCMDLDLAAVMQQQNQMTKLLVDHNNMAALPLQKLQVFKGDPLKYKAFVRAFKHGIEAKTHDSEDRLYYLEQSTADDPGELVASCIHMDPEGGYTRARELLEKKYGNAYVIAQAYTTQAENWPDIKAEDKSAMNNFSVFLTKCENAMKGEPYLKEMDNHKNLQMLIDKLPYKMR